MSLANHADGFLLASILADDAEACAQLAGPLEMLSVLKAAALETMPAQRKRDEIARIITLATTAGVQAPSASPALARAIAASAPSDADEADDSMSLATEPA